MKNIFIGGVARSGKSTFSRKIKENNKEYNHIPIDYFSSSLKHNFKETGITCNAVIDKNSSKKLSLLLSRVIKIIDLTDEKFIIDSAHILPNDIIPYLDKDKWDIYYLGYTSITSKDKLKLIRKYDGKCDWTSDKSDEELLIMIEKLIDLSKEIKQDCIDNDITFIDTSFSFNDTNKYIDRS